MLYLEKMYQSKVGIIIADLKMKRETPQRSFGMELIAYNNIASPELDASVPLIGNGEELVLGETDSLDLF